MTLTAYERETVIVMNDEELTARIWTAQRRIITKLKKNPAARLLEEGRSDGSPWARFELPREFVSFRSTAVKLSLSDQQRAERAARLVTPATAA
jgi:hypothetical protein